MYRCFLKRLFDVLFSGTALIVLAIPMSVISVWLYFANKRSGVFFHQERPGKNGMIFRIHKFKSMTDDRDAKGNLLPDRDRLTKVGRFVRATSLDELPQLWNVFIGEMSLIGPRPLLVKYLPLYTPEQARRHNVRPGITGWAQVHGRNLCKLSDKFRYDVYYADNLSFLLDCRILLMTITNVLKRKDVGVGAENMKDIDDLHFRDRYMD